MGIIEIEGMEFYASHGHYEVEQAVGTRFLVDIRVQLDLSKAAQSDDLDDALNYQEIYDLVKREMGIVSNLLEHIAQRILTALKMQFPQIENARVKIAKMNPAMGGVIKQVSISLST